MPSERITRPETPQSFLAKGGGWVIAQSIAMVGWLVLTPLSHSISRSPLLLVPAVLLLASGAAAGIAGTRVLGKSLTPFPKPPPDTGLVQTGVYSLVRHPLYASLIALSLGWACLWQSGFGVVLAALQALLLDAKARREERWLRQQFAEYAVYAAKVRRLIPWVY